MRIAMRSISLLIAVAALVAAAPAHAAEDGSDKATKNRWEAGGRFHFVTANPVLNVLYDEHESVNGFTVGPTFTRKSPDGQTVVVFGADYTSVKPEDGAWLADGKQNGGEEEWTEFRTGSARGFSIYSANVLVGHVFKNGPFGFFFGGGIGLDYIPSTITTYPTTNGGTIKAPGGAPEEKNVPQITPTVLFKMGPQFELGRAGTVSLDVGLHNGLFAGVSLSIRI
jgi:hypothetical protein